MTNYSYDYEAKKMVEESVETDKNSFEGDPMDYIIANDFDYLEGRIIEYIANYTSDYGVEDLIKARYLLDELIKRERR